ncbi:MAG: GIN domain-containing protein [Massilia sp.]
MNKLFKLGLVAAASCTVWGIAAAEPDVASETRQVDARVVRVKLDGMVDLRIRQGSVPRLVLTGDPRWIERTTTLQSGDTLNIGAESRGFRMHRASGLHAELTLPRLREVVSESIGSTEVSGFAGDELELTLDGAGSMKVWCNYKMLTANMGGIGSMQIGGLSAEGIDVRLRGAGSVVLNGRSKWLKADLGGLGGLDAQQFAADSVDLDLSGLGNATVTAHQNATLNLSGMGSVTVYGKPLNRKVSVDGLGKVSWK